MSDEHFINGKRIEFAPSDGVERFQATADEFMLRIFDFEPGHYLITDESSLQDFKDHVDSLDQIHDRIRAEYGLTVDELKDGNLLKIFRRIHQLRELNRRPVQ